MVKGDLDIVKLLVQEGARLNITDADDRTPLIKAILSGTKNPQQNLQICQVLIQGDEGLSERTRDHYLLHYDRSLQVSTRVIVWVRRLSTMPLNMAMKTLPF